MLCTLVLNGLVDALSGVAFTAGDEFNVVVISFDPRDTPALASAKRQAYLERYDRGDSELGWHFLTGSQDSITLVTEAVGFRYAYDETRNEFAHASCAVILTPKGTIARYFYGVTFVPRDLRLGLVEASEHRIGNAIDQVLLFCYHYDPATGKYAGEVMTAVRAGGVLTIAVLGLLVTLCWYRGRQHQRPPDGDAGRNVIRSTEAQ